MNTIKKKEDKVKKLLSQLSEREIKELQKQFPSVQKLAYSLIGTNKYHSKVNKTKGKVNIYYLKMLGMETEDLIQFCFLCIWEGMIKYGNFPENSKAKEEGKKASLCTFLYKHLYFQLINLGIKADSKKNKRTDIDISSCFNLSESISPEDRLLFEEEYKNRIEKEEENNNKFLEKVVNE